MSQADGYVRIVTRNDTTEAQRTTEQLGDTIHDALDTSPADNMTQAVNEVQSATEQLSDTMQNSMDTAPAQQMAEAVNNVQSAAENLGEAVQDSLDTAPAQQMADAVVNVQQAAEQLGEVIQDSIDTTPADNMADAVLNVQESAEQLGTAITDATDTAPADDMTGAMGGLEDGINDTGDAALKTGDIIKANLVSEAVTQGIQKLGEVLKNSASRTIEIADGLDRSVNKIAAATNASAEEMEKLRSIVTEIYGDNFGEGFEDIADSIAKIKQNLGELDDRELVKVTESAYALKDVFDYDIAESSRAVKAMVENFGISASEAYDYIARGAQNGLDYSGELLDNISEYSVQFKKMGLSASDMFTIFSNGAENGAWNLDKIGDSVKEMAIRVIDGSDTSKQGFEALGFEADSIAKIKQNLGELDDRELVKVTESAYALKDVFDYDIAESSRAVKAMVENFGVSASEAYDYIARAP